ncbi:PDZ domain-containing protein [Fulvitalea axinellae]|uniref:PDZ domain-containing protein n=1 Tax=Fulvitalea axinellae TaxID=1182444 RepID=UPI0030CA2CBE
MGLLLFVSIFLHLGASAQKRSWLFKKKETVDIPFELVNNLMLVPLKINSTDSLRFILDTGVSTTILTNGSVIDTTELNRTRRITLHGMGEDLSIEALITFGNKLEIESLKMTRQAIICLDSKYINLSEKMGTKVDGIMSFNLFKNHLVYIDYTKKIIHLHPHSAMRRRFFRKMDMLPLKIRNGKPFMEVTCTYSDGHERSVNLLVDSGASHALWLKPDGRESELSYGLSDTVFLGTGLSGAVNGYYSKLPKIAMNSYKLRNVSVAFPTKESYSGHYEQLKRDGSLGSEILRRYHVLFDYRGERMLFRRNKHFREPFRRNLSGLEIIVPFVGLPIYEISHIRPDSPASQAGLKVGDQLLEINHKNTLTLDLSDIQSILERREGRFIKLVLLRNGKKIYSEFKLQEFVKQRPM